MPPGVEKFVGIAELKGWGYSNSDVRGYLNALSILQVYIVIVCMCVWIEEIGSFKYTLRPYDC
jgi:hypothetical protein